MEKTKYRIDLQKSGAMALCIRHKTLGVGSASCGSRPLPQYLVFAELTSFTYAVMIKHQNNRTVLS